MDSRTGRVANEGSVANAALWMIGLSILLFWLPVIGPAIAGFIGGTKAKTMGKAMAAAFVPAILLGVAVAAVLIAFDLPLIGTIAGIGVLIAILVEDVPMFIGAAVGAAMSQ